MSLPTQVDEQLELEVAQEGEAIGEGAGVGGLPKPGGGAAAAARAHTFRRALQSFELRPGASPLAMEPLSCRSALCRESRIPKKKKGRAR